MKKFYKTATTQPAGKGFEIHLDGKPVQTPLGETLLIPTEKLAHLVVAEWEGQNDIITPETLPLTRLANTAQDVTTKNYDKVLSEVVAFAAHDLLCYRTGEPIDLHREEAALWDPYLVWAKKTHGIILKTTNGITPVEQSKAALEQLTQLLAGTSAYLLTGIHNATTITGSVILALALAEGFQKPDAVWQAAHVDEDYQRAKWGREKEAEKVRAARRSLFDAVCQFMAALNEAPSAGKKP